MRAAPVPMRPHAPPCAPMRGGRPVQTPSAPAHAPPCSGGYAGHTTDQGGRSRCSRHAVHARCSGRSLTGAARPWVAIRRETQMFIELDVKHKTLVTAHSAKENELVAAK